jgi:hypothetical protein
MKRIGASTQPRAEPSSLLPPRFVCPFYIQCHLPSISFGEAAEREQFQSIEFRALIKTFHPGGLAPPELQMRGIRGGHRLAKGAIQPRAVP